MLIEKAAVSRNSGALRSAPGSALRQLLYYCFLTIAFLILVIVLLALRQREGKSLSRHLVACQILVVGGDLIDQLAVDDFHDPVRRRLHHLMVTGGENDHAGELLHSII